MIRYTLSCAKGHGFDSWFQNATAFDALAAAGQLACPVCGATSIEKSLMAPSVRPARKAAEGAVTLPEPPASTPPRPSLSEAKTDLEKALAALRHQVETTSEYVGMNFVTEARRMHDGETAERAIYGEARPDEARKLLEDGVPVAPLPFRPARKTN